MQKLVGTRCNRILRIYPDHLLDEVRVHTTFTVFSIHQNQLKFIRQRWVFCHLFNRTNRPENLMHFRTWPDRGSIQACSISHSEVQPHNLCMQRAQSSASSWPIWTWTGRMMVQNSIAIVCSFLSDLVRSLYLQLRIRTSRNDKVRALAYWMRLVLLVTWSDRAI